MQSFQSNSMQFLKLTILLNICSTFPLFAQDIIFNEIMADNQHSQFDPDFKQPSDWIELYNSGSQNIDLSGYTLTDEATPDKWTFPAGVSIQSNTYLIIWADNQNITGDALHTNFKLNRGGETIHLFDPNGSQVDVVDYPALMTDVSYGRHQDNKDQWYFFDKGTPGSINSEGGTVQQQKTLPPTFSHLNGNYRGPQNVTLMTQTNMNIHYTLDGSVPTRQSPLYTSAIPVSKTTVIRARSFQEGYLASAIVNRVYLIDESTTLPIVSLIIQPEYFWDDEYGIYVDQDIAKRKEWERSAQMTYFENGSLAFEETVDIRLFGRTAIYIPQKSLSLFPENPITYPVFGNDSALPFQSLLLRSSSDDWHRTMLADAFLQQLLKPNFNLDIQEYQPAILFLNNDYWGIHNLREKYNENYLANHHPEASDNIDLIYLDVRDNLTQLLSGNMDHYNALMDFVQTRDLTAASNYAYIQTQVDIDNFIDYCIVQHYTGNISWKHNMRLWRPQTSTGQWQFLIFDLDRGFRELSRNNISDMRENLPLFDKLIENPNFKNKYNARFQEHMNVSFRPDHVIAVLDSLSKRIEDEIPRHSNKWRDSCGNNVCGISSSQSWKDYLNELKFFAENRLPIVHEQLTSLYSEEKTASLTIDIDPQNGGSVSMNQTSELKEFDGIYPVGTSLSLNAEPAAGYIFEGWKRVDIEESSLIPPGSTWKYLDNGSDQGSGWQIRDFDDSAWLSGNGIFGYGDNNETTTLSFGDDDQNKHITTYFRHILTLNELTYMEQMTLNLLKDDGAIVYINGNEVIRTNLPDGNIDYQTPASVAIADNDEIIRIPYLIPMTEFKQGDNIIAVEIHQVSATSSDLSFDLSLSAKMSEKPSTIPLITMGSTWHYWDQGNLSDEQWQSVAYQNAAWQSGAAPLGYGDDGISTIIGFGPDEQNKYIITYFRKSFKIDDAHSYRELTLNLIRDDGAVCYLNGQEIVRSNISDGALTDETFALAFVGGDDELSINSYQVDANFLNNGINTLAVALYQANLTSSDLRFDLSLDGIKANDAIVFLSTEPLLQYQITEESQLKASFIADQSRVLAGDIIDFKRLTMANSPYLILNDVTVTESGWLYIEPGVTLNMAENTNLLIHGNIQLFGTKAYPISIQSHTQGEKWGAISVIQAPDSTIFSYINLTGASKGPGRLQDGAINILESSAWLSHVTIEKVQQPFYANNSSIVIQNCIFDGTETGDDLIHVYGGESLLENNIIYGIGEIDFDFADGLTLRGNHFINTSNNPNSDGIDIGSCLDALIENNLLENCPDKGVSIGEASTATLRGNIILNCGMGVAVKDSSIAILDRNTFHQNGIGVSCYEKVTGKGGGFATITNSIFSSSSESDISLDHLSSASVQYSLSNTALLNGIGNIMADPDFVSINHKNFALNPGSPAIDTGDPDSTDPDGSRADMGAKPFRKQSLQVLRNLKINELMASNTRTLVDELGRYGDWIEIYNANNVPVDLGGLWLSDDKYNLALHQIPNIHSDSTTIDQHSYHILWPDHSPQTGHRHLDFRLSRNGEFLALTYISKSDTVILDSLTFGIQQQDISYGRSIDGENNWQFFSQPSPNASNQSISSAEAKLVNLPTRFALHQNFPNPFNPGTTIRFDLPENTTINLTVLDVMGRHVKTLANKSFQAGYHRVYWDATDKGNRPVAAGMYFYQLKTMKKMIGTYKMVLIK